MLNLEERSHEVYTQFILDTIGQMESLIKTAKEDVIYYSGCCAAFRDMLIKADAWEAMNKEKKNE